MKRAFIVLLLTVSAFAAKKSTPPPSVTIHASPEAIKSRLVAHLVSAGYSISNDTQFETVFWKPAGMGANLLTKVMLGNSYSEDAKENISFYYSQAADQTAVIANAEISMRQALGNTERVPLTTNKKTAQNLQELLDTVKVEAEAGAETEKSKTSPAYFGAHFRLGPAASGVALVSVEHDGPAEKAGLRGGDVITFVNDRALSSGTELAEIFNSAKPGEALTFSYVRPDDGNKFARISVTLGEKAAVIASH